MAVEIEAKIAVDDFKDIRRRLNQLGAKRRGTSLETNTFFDTRTRAFFKSDQGLRLRKRIATATKKTNFIITYKGPRKRSKLKSREEIEIEVCDERDVIKILSKLGYQRMASFKKTRESWKLGKCSIELDTVQSVGKFIEIEGPGERVILKVRHQLGLDDSPLIQDSYIAMVLSKRKSTLT